MCYRPIAYQSNVWMGKPGLITHTHYDAQHNFFVQLQGRKRFTLLPPHATAADGSPLPVFPCLHPHFGHLAPAPSEHVLPLFEPVHDNTSTSTSSSLSLPLAYIAELGAGDMLVVPSFWWHHVETLEASVSVNVWSTAPEYKLIAEVILLAASILFSFDSH
jgi:hypoxia-inducible factor 1-alpha inhibitor (HIF hydroxylase)